MKTKRRIAAGVLALLIACSNLSTLAYADDGVEPPPAEQTVEPAPEPEPEPQPETEPEAQPEPEPAPEPEPEPQPEPAPVEQTPPPAPVETTAPVTAPEPAPETAQEPKDSAESFDVVLRNDINEELPEPETEEESVDVGTLEVPVEVAELYTVTYAALERGEDNALTEVAKAETKVAEATAPVAADAVEDLKAALPEGYALGEAWYTDANLTALLPAGAVVSGDMALYIEAIAPVEEEEVEEEPEDAPEAGLDTGIMTLANAPIAPIRYEDRDTTKLFVYAGSDETDKWELIGSEKDTGVSTETVGAGDAGLKKTTNDATLKKYAQDIIDAHVTQLKVGLPAGVDVITEFSQIIKSNGANNKGDVPAVEYGGYYTWHADYTPIQYKYHAALNYNVNGGDSAAPAPTTSDDVETTTRPDSNTTVSVPVTGEKPTREGYDFLGWATDAGAAASNVSGSVDVPAGGSVTLYAVWQETKEEIPDPTPSNSRTPSITMDDWFYGEPMEGNEPQISEAQWTENYGRWSITYRWVQTGSVSYSTGSKPVDAGEYTVSATFKEQYQWNGQWRDVTNFLGQSVTTTVSDTFTIKPRTVTVIADSDEKTYDGTPLTKNSYTLEPASFTAGGTGFVDGEGFASVTIVGNQTDAGSSDNKVDSYTLQSNTKSQNYKIGIQDGTLTVKKAELIITKEVVNPKTENYKPGDPVTYKITVQNSGNAPAEDVTIADELPKGLVNAFGQTLTWSNQTIPAGGKFEKTVSGLMVAGDAAGEVVNTATYTYGTENKSATAAITVDGTPAPEPGSYTLTVTKKVEGAVPEENKSDKYDFTVTYTVEGEAKSESLTLGDGESDTVENIPEGTEVTITETVPADAKYRPLDGAVLKATMDKDRTVTFINYYDHQPHEPEVDPYTYKLTYDPNGEGVSSMPAEVTVESKDPSHTFDLSTQTSTPTRDGYVFKGWALDKDSTAVSSVEVNALKREATVYAVWAVDTNKDRTPDDEQEVVITIKGREVKESYNGKEHTASGYDIVSVTIGGTDAGTALPKGVTLSYEPDTEELYVTQTNAGTYNYSTAAVEAKSTGTYKSVTVVPQDGHLDIEKAKVTIVVKDKEITYGEDLPEFDYVTFMSSLYNGDKFEAELTDTYAGAGKYTIGIKDKDSNPNYEVTVKTGTLTVNPAKVDVTITGVTRTIPYDGVEYGVYQTATSHDALYTVSIEPEDLAKEVKVELTEAAAAEKYANVGTYLQDLEKAFNVTSTDNVNVNVTYVNGGLTITPVTATTPTTTTDPDPDDPDDPAPVAPVTPPVDPGTPVVPGPGPAPAVPGVVIDDDTTPLADAPEDDAADAAEAGNDYSINADGAEGGVTIDEDDTALGLLDITEDCCILHLLIMLAALAVTVYYTHNRKKHQSSQFELRRELGIA